MKKIFLRLFSIIIVFVIIPCLTYMYSVKSSRIDFEKDMKSYEEIIFTNVKTMNDNNLDEFYKNTIEKMPEKIKNAIIDDEWHFYIVDDISSFYKNGVKYKPIDSNNYSLRGITISIQRMVIIQYSDNLSTMYEVTIHEIGHLVNYEFGNICNSGEFEKLYKEKIKEINIDEYATVASDEFFAEVFKQYILSSELIDEQPEIVSFYDSMLLNSQTVSSRNINGLKTSLIGGYRTILSTGSLNKSVSESNISE